MSIDFSQFKGIHSVTKQPERVWVGKNWSIEVPKGYTYSLDPDLVGSGSLGTYFLHVQNSEDCNFEVSYSSVFNLVVYGNLEGTNLNNDDMSKEDVIESLESLPTHLISHYNVYKQTRDLVVLYSVENETDDYSMYHFQIAVRGCNLVYTGQFNCSFGTVAARKEEIFNWLNTIETLSESERLAFSDYSGLTALKIPTRYTNSFAEIDDGIKISIPDGFHAETNPSIIGDNRKLVIVPKDYSFYENPMEATIALTVQSQIIRNFPTREEIIDKYFDLLCTSGLAFKRNCPSYMYKHSDKAFALSQLFINEDCSVFSRTALFAKDNLYIITIIISYQEHNYDELLAEWDVDKLSKAWIGRICVEGETVADYQSNSTGDRVFSRAVPEKSLYPHYDSLLARGSLSVPGATVIVNAGGTEYQFIPLDSLSKDEDVEIEMRDLYTRIIAKDEKNYDLYDKAIAMQPLFHVNAHAFDPRHDRECELEEGLLHRAYMLNGLRSFAWTLASYCNKHNCLPDDIDSSTASEIANFVARHNWLNYEGDTNCAGLCSGSDLHVYFIPDSVTASDRGLLLPSQEDYDRVRQMKGRFPSYREILAEVHSLNALREDLDYIYPAILALWESLRDNRNYDEPLLGNEADIVYSWCALALAARGPFFTEDGPMTCHFKQLAKTEPQVTPKRNENNKLEQPKGNDKATASKKKRGKKTYVIEDGKLIEYNGTAFTPLIPIEVSVIGSGTFEGNVDLHCIEILDNIKKIEAKAFQNCPNLFRIIIPDIPITIDKNAFTNCPKLYIDTVSGSAAEKYCKENGISCKTDGICAKSSEVKKKNRPEEFVIDNGSLLSYTGDNPVVKIPKGVKKIGASAFASSSVIREVDLNSDELEDIEANTFSNCSHLEHLTLGGKLTVHKNTVVNCPLLQFIHIPRKIKGIEEGAFSKCPSLEWVSLPQTLKNASNEIVMDCPAFKRFRVSKLNPHIKTINGAIIKRAKGELPQKHDAQLITEDPVVVDNNLSLKRQEQFEYRLYNYDFIKADHICISGRLNPNDYKTSFSVNLHFQQSYEWMFFEHNPMLPEKNSVYAVLDLEGNVFAEKNVQKDSTNEKHWNATVNVYIVTAKDRAYEFAVSEYLLDSEKAANTAVQKLLIPALNAVLKTVWYNSLKGQIPTLSVDVFKLSREAILQAIIDKPYSPTKILEEVSGYTKPDALTPNGFENSEQAKLPKEINASETTIDKATEKAENKSTADTSNRQADNSANCHYLVMVQYAHQKPYFIDFSFPEKYIITPDPEDKQIVNWIDWRTCNSPNYTNLESMSGDVDGIASIANFSCIAKSSSGDFNGALLDVLYDCFQEQGEKMLLSFSAEINAPLKDDQCEAIAMLAINPSDSTWNYEMAVINYADMTLNKETWEGKGTEEEVVDVAKKCMTSRLEEIHASAIEKQREEVEAKIRAETEIRMKAEAERIAREEAEVRAKAEEIQRIEKVTYERAKYDELCSRIEHQKEIIAQNKGWFGTPAKLRKAAQEELHYLERKMQEEFPNGEPSEE